MLTVQPTGTRVLLLVVGQTRDGHTASTAKVIALGEATAANVFSVGDLVLIGRYAGSEIDLGGEPHAIVDQTEILGIVRDQEPTGISDEQKADLIAAARRMRGC